MNKTQYMAELKYKVGDRVRIKNFDWFRNEGANMVVVYMTKYYGEVVTIKSVHKGFYRIKEDGGQYCWIDEMFECKMEEETKPELKFKVGDRIYSKYHKPSNDLEIIEILSMKDGNYAFRIKNHKTNGTYLIWGYEMSNYKLVEEETKPEINFKVGDKITNGKDTLTILTLTPDRYVAEDNLGECGILYFNSQDGWKIVEEETKPKYEDEVNGEYYSTPKYLVRPSGYQFIDENGNVINAQKIVLEKLVVPKFKRGDKIKDKNNKVWYVAQVGNKHFDISRVPDGPGYFIPMEDQDDYELCPNRELPKTFEDCVSVLMCEGGNRMSLEQMNTFRKLIDARNAYWTIYGIENGLGKPWEPTMETVYCISRNENVMKCSYRGGKSNVLEFPTEEMRDIFYENFKTEIESCKEFL